MILNDEIILSIYNIVGNEICVDPDDGKKVFENITKILDLEKKVVISFQNVEILTSDFLNTAIGQLYGKYTEEFIKKNIKIVQLAKDDILTLKLVTNTAKLYYKDHDVIN